MKWSYKNFCACVPLVLQPVANLLPIRVVPHQVGGAQLGEMPTHGLNRPPSHLGELARCQRTAALQRRHQLVDHRVSQQPAHSGLPIFHLVHRRRSTGTPVPCQATLRRFENSRNIEMKLEASNCRIRGALPDRIYFASEQKWGSCLAMQHSLIRPCSHLRVLIGKPASILSIPAAPLAMTTVPPPIPVGVPSEVLERRPGIAAAERQVVAANAQIGAAQAAYYPTVSLAATGGFESSSLGRWLSAPSRFWSVGPTISETVSTGVYAPG
jgi:Outer membrane efflux protein